MSRVTEEEISEWVRRYEAGEGLRTIARAVGRSHLTVRSHVSLHTPIRDQARGESHWNWKGGVAKRPDLGTPAYRKARAERFRMSGGKCERCGGRATHCHHEVEGSDAVEDLRALCQWCHMQAHGSWPTDEQLLDDYRSGLTEKQSAEKYGVNINTAAKFRHYARGLARGRRMAVLS